MFELYFNIINYIKFYINLYISLNIFLLKVFSFELIFRRSIQHFKFSFIHANHHLIVLK